MPDANFYDIEFGNEECFLLICLVNNCDCKFEIEVDDVLRTIFLVLIVIIIGLISIGIAMNASFISYEMAYYDYRD